MVDNLNYFEDIYQFCIRNEGTFIVDNYEEGNVQIWVKFYLHDEKVYCEKRVYDLKDFFDNLCSFCKKENIIKGDT